MFDVAILFRTTAPGSPVTGAQPRPAGPCGCLHVDPRPEPGAVVPHAGIGAGGARQPASLPRPSTLQLSRKEAAREEVILS